MEEGSEFPAAAGEKGREGGRNRGPFTRNRTLGFCAWGLRGGKDNVSQSLICIKKDPVKWVRCNLARK